MSPRESSCQARSVEDNRVGTIRRQPSIRRFNYRREIQMLEPEGRVVMISGARRGLGRAIAERLLSSGYTISAGIRDTTRLPDHPRFFAYQYDATVPEDGERWVATTVERLGRIDAVINAAGISVRGRLLDHDESAFDAMWETNTKAPMRVIRAAWPYLAVSGEGRIVNLSSLSGKRVRNDNLAYAMSKFAIMALTHETRRLGWDLGIRATALCPGFVDTDMTANVTKLPRSQMSRPEDIASVVETVLRLSNSASIAEVLVNCRHEDML